MMYQKLSAQMLCRVPARVRVALVLVLLVVALGVQPVPVAYAATRYVATTGTNAPGCTDPANPCRTITYAIGQAVAGDTINVAAGTYTEAGISVNKNLTIAGAGMDSTTVQAHANYGSASDRVFVIESGVTATIEKMTIRHGNIPGGMGSEYGGGIYNGGTLTLNNCIVTRNVAGLEGGGIKNRGTLTLNNSTVSDNWAGAGSGGIVHGDGTMWWGTLTLNNSTVRNNWGGTGSGGIGLYGGTVTLNNSTVSGNSTGGPGGGIGGIGGPLTLNKSTVNGNTADSYGGGISMECQNCQATLENSTVSGNQAKGDGGGIFFKRTHVYGVVLNVTHSTITDNVADSDNNGGSGGGIWSGATGGYDPATVNYKSSIIAGNRRYTSNSDCSGSIFNTQGYNLLGSGGGCPSGGTGDQTPTDAKLGLLDLNGGQVGGGGGPKTHALLATSPALDQIPYNINGCGTTYTTDERGKTRPANTQCDVGAFEKQSTEKTGSNATWSQNVQYDFNTQTPDINVKMTPTTSDNPGTVTILKRSEWPGGSQNSGEFQIVWTLTASGSTYNLNVVLCYTGAELSGSGVSDENTITAYRWNEDTRAWVAQTTARDPDNNCVTVSGVTALSPWTLVGDGGTPTALVLRAFRARTVDSLVYAGVVLAFLLFLGGGLALLQHRLGQRRRS